MIYLVFKVTLFYDLLLIWGCNLAIKKVKKVKLATLVKGDPKVLFSIATIPRCWEGHNSIPRIDPLYPWSSLYSAEC